MESIAAKIEGSENEVKWRLETRFKQKWQSKEKKKKKNLTQIGLRCQCAIASSLLVVSHRCCKCIVSLLFQKYGSQQLIRT